MSQNTPNNPPGQAQDSQENPYSANWQGGGAPDLDAEAPVLRADEAQRLNRKALMYLAGIVALLLLTAIWLARGMFSGDDAKRAPPQREERVVIPDAPTDVMLPQLPPERAPEFAEPLPLAQVPMPSELPPLPPAQPAAPSGPSLLERRIGRSDSPVSDATTTPPEMPSLEGVGADSATQMRASLASARPLYKPDTLMVRGTYIRCVLETRVITDVPGFTSCVVTEPVYSINGRRLLLPKGSKVLGTYGSAATGGNRVAVVWDRITTPNGLDINMSSPGVDDLGSSGHPGHYDAHWPQRISSALLISMISDAFKYVGAKHGPQQVDISNGTVVQSPYESNTARTMERMANMALERNMARQPTVTINQGEVVNVYVAQDVDFSSVLR
ncbi:TrbI/VirB10 family protein [Marilutibacter alkalisoli]|uniref:TrbI/VirB10 family protein n=1 Tax=Marilutibacter alkalisoli TaxID=2591633 RepID=A0A514BVC7_9GAMM|nr:TrbI/VirB10 family protein [Lysobacter alkalisoli]QDH71358.1 TrbI/VirB10 family protein [Lysobacter alkalisoli]